MGVINSLIQLWLCTQVYINPTLQCSSLVSPHPVMALKLSVENGADMAIEGSELSSASSEELTSITVVLNQDEMLSLPCSLCKLVVVWFGPSDLLPCRPTATLQTAFVQRGSQEGCLLP